MTDHWRDTVVQRGVHELETIAYPKHAPLTARPDWRPAQGMPGADVETVRAQALDPFAHLHRRSATVCTVFSC